jgi:hypothetical protein
LEGKEAEEDNENDNTMKYSISVWKLNKGVAPQQIYEWGFNGKHSH